MGRAFKTPSSDDAEQWKKVQSLYAYGFRFHGYGNRSDLVPLPDRLREVEAFVKANPEHPYRVAAVDLSLLP